MLKRKRKCLYNNEKIIKYIIRNQVMFGIEGENFVLDGKKVFLNSGEIHYFRIKRELWDDAN